MVEKPLIIPQPIQPSGKAAVQRQPATGKQDSFSQVLQRQMQQAGELKFSRHALERLNARDIELKDEHLHRLNEAVKKARAKGCRDSLILVDDLAFLVSVKNGTVITAVDGDSRKENVFTNIDSAVIN